MSNSELLNNIKFHLTSVDHCSVGTEWNYKNIISSFSRLFLVTSGVAWLHMGQKKIQMRKGHIYLVPSFTPCSYLYENEMEHYYATFTIQLQDNFSIYQLFNFKHRIEATPEHFEYFKRLHEINPLMTLPADDPKIYQRLNSNLWNYSVKDAERIMTSSGLLYLLLVKFICSAKIDFEKGNADNILTSIKYIHTHLSDELSVSQLAEMSFLTTGHFTRKFKQLTHLAPLEYINKQRIERAQLLLNTTSQSCVEIAEAFGYKSNAYFSKIFKKMIGMSPNEYRKNQV